MKKIENAQKELCEYLISIMPVEWNNLFLFQMYIRKSDNVDCVG